MSVNHTRWCWLDDLLSGGEEVVAEGLKRGTVHEVEMMVVAEGMMVEEEVMAVEESTEVLGTTPEGRCPGTTSGSYTRLLLVCT